MRVFLFGGNPVLYWFPIIDFGRTEIQYIFMIILIVAVPVLNADNGDGYNIQY